jgi:O-antigen ligase
LAIVALLPRRWLAIPLLLAVATFGLISLPQDWFDRMSPATYEAGLDLSAANRLTAWKTGFEYAWKDPLTGSGFRGWTYLMLGKGRIDWHSAYVQLAAEHGLVAFTLWLLLLWGTMLQLGYEAIKSRRETGPERWSADYGAALAVALLAYLIGSAFLSIAYWELPYLLVMLAIGASHVKASEADPTAAPSAIGRWSGAWSRSRLAKRLRTRKPAHLIR